MLSMRRQCELAGVHRSRLYYKPASESAENLKVMRVIDEEFTRHPFYGSRRMVTHLWRQDLLVNRKRVQRLMRLMGLEAIYPKPRLSDPDKQHRRFPYLLNNAAISGPNQVWSTDITYVRLSQGFLYLVAVMDWFSRYVLSWRLSNTMDASFCLEALDDAFQVGSPEIFNSDQGSQFTSAAFTDKVLATGAKMSMDGKGRCFDNIFNERLWRSYKYEEVYLNDYDNVAEAHDGTATYWEFYNNERPHQSLSNRTPSDVYHDGGTPH